MKVYSSISSEIKKLKLKKGLLFSLPAIILLITFGTFASLDLVVQYGRIIFFVSITLIAIGMIPYRRITRLESTPHILSIEDDTLDFKYLGKFSVLIPLREIKSISFFRKKQFFGLALTLHSLKNVQSKNFAMRQYQKKCRRQLSCDLFLPYFPEKIKSSLVEQCHAFSQDQKERHLPL